MNPISHTLSLVIAMVLVAGVQAQTVEVKNAWVRATVQGPITTACPASILRLHPDATLYIDSAAASFLA